MPKVYDPILCMMVEEKSKARDESYIVRGRKYKVVKRDGDNVTVIGPDGKVTKMHIDFLMSEGKKAHDSASALDKAIKTIDASLPEWLVTAESDLGEHVEYTTRKAAAAEAKAEAEKMGLNNVQVRKY